MLLKLAVKAKLPLIAIRTRDTLNLTDTLTASLGFKPTLYDPTKQSATPQQVHFFLHPKSKTEINFDPLYQTLVNKGVSLIVVNPATMHEAMFDCGELPIPKELIVNTLSATTGSIPKAEALMKVLGGCTLKEAVEMACLTMARDASLTPKGLMLTRKGMFQANKGLSQITTDGGFYEPSKELKEWVATEKKWFLTSDDHRLITRGLLMDGPPGVGKTAAAKYIAEQWEVPLFRVDVGGTKNKWLGESEQNMLTNLSRLDQEEPCIALFDEVEKVFGDHQDGGTTATMMSQMLWWLAERKSRVLVIMTTNNAKALPPELYREGRINKVMWFGGLEIEAAKAFVQSVLKTFDITAEDYPHAAAEIAAKAMQTPITKATPYTVSHAKLTEGTYAWIKAKT